MQLNIQYNIVLMTRGVLWLRVPIIKRAVFNTYRITRFYRPRDLILFFKALPESNFTIPLTKKDINSLISKYGREAGNELRNELSAHYTPQESSIIFQAPDKLSEQDNFTYKTFCKGEGV